jgi:hypothetical protein
MSDPYLSIRGFQQQDYAAMREVIAAATIALRSAR